ncbi:hypothetical protein [Deinococcus multiflagellatus]|uniref:Trimeric autotransporter adhesin YadA-like head domain-containing protein n=1 Tax=Deinococcus multiflagellatus TaxID=1656887 RepID=A0ABW1ZQ94_9DEIO
MTKAQHEAALTRITTLEQGGGSGGGGSVGSLTGTPTDMPNVVSGNGATAGGLGSEAQGDGALAHGRVAGAYGDQSVAFGDSSQAFADNSVALAGGTTDGVGSMAVGGHSLFAGGHAQGVAVEGGKGASQVERVVLAGQALGQGNTFQLIPGTDQLPPDMQPMPNRWFYAEGVLTCTDGGGAYHVQHVRFAYAHDALIGMADLDGFTNGFKTVFQVGTRVWTAAVDLVPAIVSHRLRVQVTTPPDAVGTSRALLVMDLYARRRG